MTSRLSLTLALPKEARFMALIDGAVRPEGIELRCSHQFNNPGERLEKVREGQYDAGEEGIGTYIAARAKGRSPHIGLPIYTVRGFRHGNVFCRADSGITAFAGLRGKAVGVTKINATSIVWTRGLLHESGALRQSIEWICAEEEKGDFLARNLNTRILNTGAEALWEMVRRGKISGAIVPGDNGFFSMYPGGPLFTRVTAQRDLRLIQKDTAAISDYYRRTGIYPIIHFMMMKKDVADRHPEAAGELLKAFRRARELEANYLDDEQKKQANMEREFLGWDPYDYSLRPENRKAIDVLMDYLVEDGLIDRKLPVESLFVPEVC